MDPVHRADGSWSWAGESGAFNQVGSVCLMASGFYFDPKDPYHRMLVGVHSNSSRHYMTNPLV